MPSPLVNQMLLTSAQSDLDAFIVTEHEFEPACEGLGHPTSTNGHDSTQPATHYIKCPMCKHTLLICQERSTTIYGYNRVRCEGCNIAIPPTDFEINRIPK